MTIIIKKKEKEINKGYIERFRNSCFLAVISHNLEITHRPCAMAARLLHRGFAKIFIGEMPASPQGGLGYRGKCSIKKSS